MAFNPNPTGYFPNIITTGVLDSGTFGLTADTTGIFIPYSDLEGYDYSTATGSLSGDIRQLCYSINEAIADVYLGDGVNTGLSTADRPAQMTYSRSSSVPNDSTIRKTYTIVLNLQVGDNLEMIEE